MAYGQKDNTGWECTVDRESLTREDAVLELTGDFMKTNHLRGKLTALVVASLVWSGSMLAQDSLKTNTGQPAANGAPAPQLAYGVPQILQLAQADVGDEIIIAYIKNSGNSYGLNADQIVYLRQQGVSDTVITTMLKQPKPGVSADTATTPAPSPTALANSGEPAPSAEAGTATIANAQTSMPVAGGTTATVNNEPVADTHAEPAFVYYPDPLAPGGNGPTVTVIYYQSAPASPGYYQRQYPPVLRGYSVVSPGIGFGGLRTAGWSGGFQNTRRFHHDWRR